MFASAPRVNGVPLLTVTIGACQPETLNCRFRERILPSLAQKGGHLMAEQDNAQHARQAIAAINDRKLDQPSSARRTCCSRDCLYWRSGELDHHGTGGDNRALGAVYRGELSGVIRAVLTDRCGLDRDVRPGRPVASLR